MLLKLCLWLYTNYLLWLGSKWNPPLAICYVSRNQRFFSGFGFRIVVVRCYLFSFGWLSVVCVPPPFQSIDLCTHFLFPFVIIYTHTISRSCLYSTFSTVILKENDDTFLYSNHVPRDGEHKVICVACFWWLQDRSFFENTNER